MKRRKLIELLNLYIDGEISAADQESLEQEISGNADARRIYNEYCRIDEATRLVYRQFRLQAPPESLPDPQAGPSFRGSIGRLRRFAMAAGGVAAAIALISGSLVIFGPGSSESDTEVIALTPAGSRSGANIASLTPVIQSFATAPSFELQTAAFGTQVPADWTPGIDIPVPTHSLDTAPQALPVYGGILWNVPREIDSGWSLSGHENSRVYRGLERRGSDEARQVLFHFRK